MDRSNMCANGGLECRGSRIWKKGGAETNVGV
jgi:hypothetical protein